MLYSLVKIPAKLALWIYARNVAINKKEILQSNGPLLIACNHPNSFLDAIIIATIFKRPVYSLARGDAFGNAFYARLLRSLKMFPVYRVSEGVENLEQNYKTFEDCKNIFKQNGIVLIFSEGRCINEWHLRPLKKGTARLAISSWQDGIPLKVLPTGLNYNSFTSFGKNLQLNFGDIIHAENTDWNAANGKSILDFNDTLRTQLQQLVVSIDENDKAAIRDKFTVVQPPLKKALLVIPSLLGWLLHMPLYFSVKQFVLKTVKEEGHFDAVIMGLLFVSYPFYLGLIALLTSIFIGGWWWVLTFIVLPFCAASHVQLKRQF